MNDVCLVYLARGKHGQDPFLRFLASYRRHPAGLAHDLLLLFKGFRQENETDAWLERAKDLRPGKMMVPDRGFDLRAYGLAARRLENYAYFCFLNSFSEILAGDWLANLNAVIRTPHVGLVGATGSAESMYTNVLIQRERRLDAPFLERMWTPIRLRLCHLCFDPMPNYHIRSNAMMLARATMMKVWPRFFPTKRMAYLFENGKRSLTKRVLGMGLKALVVGRDGKAYPPPAWPRSNTFRQGSQDNLLVADNQTRQYLDASPAERQYLSSLAWGDNSSTC